MLNNQTLQGLHALKLDTMAQALAEQHAGAAFQALSFDERLGLLVDAELTERDNRRRERYLRTAKLRTNAVIEDIDFAARRGLDRARILGLAEATWVAKHHQVSIVGATGTGKTFLACALANAAVRRGHSVLYLRYPRMLDELAIARVDGRFGRLAASWARIEVLVLDDFLLRPLSADQAADTLEIIEDRAGTRSTIVASQLPIPHWHEALGEPTLADAVVDRLTKDLQRVELAGDSMRHPASDAPGASRRPPASPARRRATNNAEETSAEEAS